MNRADESDAFFAFLNKILSLWPKSLRRRSFIFPIQTTQELLLSTKTWVHIKATPAPSAWWARGTDAGHHRATQTDNHSQMLSVGEPSTQVAPAHTHEEHERRTTNTCKKILRYDFHYIT